ncbi:uncharacterized protein LOC127726539 [Mytilus californianus]|uniref:uncharacterized protein LOC127726539 n=1 Tax=Mytilus californianus TaxID=6549 RepID=UPI002245B0D4|nr:uncharacterized protein LOC127726539 [Mytilus californianus]XP_052089889.1 uncharacterized protein LOC127726539 [Mytilus californianus]
MKKIEKDIAVEEKFVQSLVKNNTKNYVNISCQINKSVQDITTIVQKFGEVSVSSDPCDVSIQNQKDRQAQIMVALPTGNIDNLTLTLQKRIDTELSNIRGCSMLPDGRMVFSCYAKDIIRVLKSDGSTDFEIGETFDVVLIGGESLAVTSSESDKINIIDLKNKILKKTIKVNSHNDEVAYKDGKLIYCARKKGLQMISLSDESVTNVINAKLPLYAHDAYVTTFGEKLFYTNNKSVNCCDYHGNILWTFCHRSCLKYPLGISVDNGGNVFVVGYLTNNVVVISPDGQNHRQLLSCEDGLDNPTVLHYDQSTNKLLVANDYNDAFVYEVELV